MAEVGHQIARAIEEAVEEEREACAMIADDWMKAWEDERDEDGSVPMAFVAGFRLRELIRARGSSSSNQAPAKED